MSAVPGDIETGQQPPMTVPLRHFIVGFAFLLLGGIVGIVRLFDTTLQMMTLTHLHLLLAGWVCITIMGAMTQFVPVWSGTQLHSRQLSVLQLWLVSSGLLGFAGSLLGGWLAVLPVFGALMVFGFWVFVYNIGRTLGQLDSHDVTEQHFAYALTFFVLLTILGYLLAVDFSHSVIEPLPVTRGNLVGAHATLAVFGAILTTGMGALYQLGPMFTQTELHGIDLYIRRFERFGYPLGVVILAAGRLLEHLLVARFGGLLVILTLLGMGVILARRLYETQVDWTPMLSRYTVLAVTIVLWAGLSLPAWYRNPIAESALFGAPGAIHLLMLGVIGFLVLGTLYHIIPFIIWVHRYSDLLGLEDVPMIDDLYNDRIAAVDFILFLGGTALIVVTEQLSLASIFWMIGGGLVVGGILLFLGNMLLVIHNHSPHSVIGILFSRLGSETATSQASNETDDRSA